MGPGGGKTSTSSSSSPFSPYLGAMGAQAWRAGKPTMQTLGAQTAEGLQTGGVNARIPSINASLASARTAASSSYQNLKNHLAQSGLLNSSFGQQLLGEEQTSTGQQIADIPSADTNQFLSMAVPTVAGYSNLGLGAESAAAGSDYTQSVTPSFWEMFQQGLNAGASGGGAAAGAYAAAA